MNPYKIPFETKIGRSTLVFAASGTCVYNVTGTQFKSIVGSECLCLLHTHEDCRHIEFDAYVSLNVLIVLKVGI